ncbi:MAG: hypothetical protein BWY75_01762 [bacterium ADurb.Bin425]|nr:MAG: hypothetical protein BWY75_01762 [bacterium ADurb.Bin425]
MMTTLVNVSPRDYSHQHITFHDYQPIDVIAQHQAPGLIHSGIRFDGTHRAAHKRLGIRKRFGMSLKNVYQTRFYMLRISTFQDSRTGAAVSVPAKFTHYLLHID